MKNKRTILAAALCAVMAVSMVGCTGSGNGTFGGVSIGGDGIKQTCKYSGCDETDLYADGYCRYHYEKTHAENMVKDAEDKLKNWVNNG